VKLGMQRSIDRRTNGSVLGYISVLVSRIERSGLECEKKKNGFKENVHPLHVFLKKTYTPTSFLFRKCAPQFRKRAPPIHFQFKSVLPHDVFFLDLFIFPLHRDSWIAAPAIILFQLHASA